MSCSNCYNGCSQIVSDQCVRYTGIDVPVLGIQSGDSLSYVEQALIEFLVSTLDGSGIKVNIDPAILCPIVSDNLPKCGDITIVDVMNALIKAACTIQEELVSLSDEVIALQNDVTAINAPYTLPEGCLGTLPTTPTTHDVVQAIVTTLCSFITNVETNYVLIADINTYIAQYLAGVGTGTKAYDKMVPYVAYEYYGSISGNFDGTGAGLGDWEKVYLCNGNNGTPDKRGRVAVGVTTGMGGGTMASAVNPGGLNPNYSLYSTFGSNGVQLTEGQLPSHTHANTVSLTDPGHTHTYKYTSNVGTSGEQAIEDGVVTNSSSTGAINSNTTGITVSITNVQTGSGEFHPNNQPAIGCYYIMYIP
jgi:microcystin-dependent protein